MSIIDLLINLGPSLLIGISVFFVLFSAIKTHQKENKESQIKKLNPRNNSNRVTKQGHYTIRVPF